MALEKIILASTSPRRKELAKLMGLDFEIVSSNYKEDMTLKLEPSELVMKFAYGKANNVAQKFKEGIVIGADTIVVFNGENIGKPKNKDEAFKQLKSFSGKKHLVYTGICLIDCKTKKTIQDYEVTSVHFKKLSDNEINSYLGTGEFADKAGSYAMQDLSSIFIKKIEGCYFNVVGLPIYNLYKNLEKMGVNIFEYKRWKSK